MVSFLDQLPELRFRFSRKELGDYGLKRLEKYDIGGLGDLTSNLIDLSSSGLFTQLLEIYVNWEDPICSLEDIARDMAAEHPFFVFAKGYLNKNPFFSNLITYRTFYYFYPFLEWLYSMYLGRNLKSEDVKLLFCSGIYERIIFNLKDFDIIEEVPKTSKEFFQNLKELNWENGKTKKIYEELNHILTLYCLNHDSGIKERSFEGEIFEVILFLAGCCAVKNGRNKITVDDVVTAHRTFYKIIRTDVSKLIEGTTSKKITISGYMVCKKCGGYYQLQPDESPDDFEKCQCGGELEFVDKNENLHLNDCSEDVS